MKPNLQGRMVLYAYFVLLIVMGALLLMLPSSYAGEEPLELIDAFFTSVSAVCVTGLATVSTADFTPLGQGIILFLIQMGGLGIITLTSLYLVFPSIRVSFTSRSIIQDYLFNRSAESPRRVVASIVIMAFAFEILGGLLLYGQFQALGIERPLFSGFFHAVSAFCNAGFSLFPDSLESFRGHWGLNLTFMVLIILGGTGFLMLKDIARRLLGRTEKLAFYTRFVLFGMALFIVTGAVVFFIAEYNNLLKDEPLGRKILAAIFQSVTTRTAGFNTLPQGELSAPSEAMTLLLMITGGNSGSTAGGLKVSTMLILILVLFRGIDDEGEIHLFGRRITQENVTRAALFFLKAFFILFLAVFILLISEKTAGKGHSFTQILFECVSALGTVGLSQGITGDLSVVGKLVISLIMFFGRVALFSLVITPPHKQIDRIAEIPKGEVIIG